MIGLGILGQLTVQLLRANGCRVIGDRPRPDARRARGATHGSASTPASDFAERARALTDGFGARRRDRHRGDAEQRSDARTPRRRAGARAAIVIVGDVGLDLQRADMYEKELDVLMSTSYGPGRYDAVYEVEGRDYPIGYVRWTENRNMEEYLAARWPSGAVRLDRLPQRALRRSTSAAQAYEALKREGERAAARALSTTRSARTPLARTTVVRNGAAPAGQHPASRSSAPARSHRAPTCRTCSSSTTASSSARS